MRKAGEIVPAKCLVGLSLLVGGGPPVPKGRRSLQEGRSAGHRGWKRRSRRPPRAQFTVERMPGLARDATAPPVPLALRLSP